MRYWVSTSHLTQRTTVHKGGCRHCRDRESPQWQPKNRHTTDWLGPYEERERAFERAAATKVSIVAACAHCKP
jgi:hypothetical protein